MKVPEYNSPQRMTSYNRLLVAILALLCIPSAYAVNSWDVPSADLAKQIAALAGPGTIALTVTNQSSISSDDVPVIRRALERELRSAGIVVRAKDADAEVRVTLSQDLQGWLWVAEVQEGMQIQVAMLPVPGAGKPAGTATSAPAMTLRSTMLAAQNEPILDVALIGVGAEQYVVTLGPDKISWYSQTVRSRPLQSYNIVHTQALPRDVRGRIVPASDHLFDAYLPGTVCTATKSGDSSGNLEITCKNSDDPWPLGSQKAFYNPARNFFTGVVLPGFGPKLPPFYSAAELVRTGGTTFLFADVSGAVHILEPGSHKLLIGARDWGSDIAGLRSQCGSGTQVLASAAGWPAADSIRAYEISGREATPLTAALNVDGDVMALWPAPDATSVTAIVGKREWYAAYSVAIDCSH